MVLEENENISAKMIVTVKEPEYTLEQAKNNTDMLNKYLNQHYGTLNTPIGDWKPVFSVDKTGVNWLDVRVDWGSYEGPMPSELIISDPEEEIKKYGHIITVEERNESKKLLREFMKKVSVDAIYAFPNYFVQGEFFTDGYRYPHIRVGYWSIRFLSWNNIIGNYQIDTKAHWDPALDDYNFVLNQQLTGFSFINPHDGELYTSNDAKFPVITLKKGEKIQLPLKITPEQDISDLTYSEIGFKSYLSKNIVSMDEHGVLEGLTLGEDLINITNRFCGGGLFIKIKVTE